MTFPTIPLVADGRALTGVQANTTATRTFPSLSGLTKNSGDLLIAICIAYQNGAGNAAFSSWGGGFTEFVDSSLTGVMAIGAAYKWSDGTETGTFTVTQATVTGHAVFILLSIPGAHASTPPTWGGRASHTTAAADPAALNPAAWDAEDTLWIDVIGVGETSTTGSFTGVTASATNYGNDIITALSGDVIGGVMGAVGFRQLNAASEDAGPGSVDTSNARNAALLIAIRPAAGVTPVAKTFDIQHDIQALVTKTFAIQHDVQALVRKDFAVQHDVQAVVAKSFAIQYDILINGIVVTARHSGSSGTGNTQAFTTGNATPTADSELFVFGGAESDGASQHSVQTPTGGSLTYNQVLTDGQGADTIPWSGTSSFYLGAALYRAAIGSSPSAFAITWDEYSGTTLGYYAVASCDITGHNTSDPIVQSATHGEEDGGGNAESIAVTLGAAPTPGNTLLCFILAGADSGGVPAAPTAGSGNTFDVVSTQSAAFVTASIFKRDVVSGDSATITCADLGQTVGNSIIMVVEIEKAAGGAAPVAKTFDIQYDVQAIVLESFAVQYDINTTVVEQFTVQHDVTATSAKTFEIRYDLLSVVLEAFAPQWDTRALTTEQFAVQYDILSRASEVFAVQWDTGALVLKSFDIDWDAQALVVKTFALQYDVLANLGVATKTLEIQYDVHERVAEAFAVVWDVTALVRKDYAIQHDLFVSARKDFTIVWDTLSNAPPGVSMGSARDNKLAWLQQQLSSTSTDLLALEWQYYTGLSGLTPAEKYTLEDHKYAYFDSQVVQVTTDNTRMDLELRFLEAQTGQVGSYQDLAALYYVPTP